MNEQIIVGLEDTPGARAALAWALTIHRAQGMSLDCCSMSLERLFADGQAYVALSRCRSLSALYLEAPVDVAHIRCNESVKKFYA